MEISAPYNPVIDKTWKQVLGEKSASSGLGIVVEYDTTDNLFWPGQGVSLSGEYQFYGHYLGGVSLRSNEPRRQIFYSPLATLDPLAYC